MTSNLNKFKLLMWKNCLLLIRSPEQAFYMFFMAIFVSLLITKFFVESQITLKEKIYTSENPILGSSKKNSSVLSLAYSPCNNHIQTILKNMDKTRFFDNGKIVCFSSAKVLEEELLKNDTNYFVGIVFEDKYNNNRTLDNKISVEFRFYSDSNWYTDEMYPSYHEPGPRNLDLKTDNTIYFDEYFLGLQILITKSLLNNNNNNTQFPQILAHKFPYPPHNKSIYLTSTLVTFYAIMIVLTCYNAFEYLVCCLSLEKENQLKESMKVMGLPGWLHFVSWFIFLVLIFIIISIILTIFLSMVALTKPLFQYSDKFVLFVFFFTYGCSVIAFGFFLTSIIQNSTLAEIVCFLSTLSTILPFYLLRQSNNLIVCLIGSLLSNSAFGFGVRIIIQFEAIGKGIQWDNFFDTIHVGDTLTFGAIILMLLVDTVLYLLIAFYIEAIFPGDFGIAQPWYFPFTLTYWCGKKIPPETDNENSTSQNNEFIEENNEKLIAGVQLKNLSKSFGRNQVVNHLNLDMYKGHITVLLGHNGAGKTTTMSMITGMISPSGGTAIVDGYDIRTNINFVRNSMGLCLQHNVLFHLLTVKEHMIFFGGLKGIPSSEIQKECDNYLHVLELEDKLNSYSSTLSGGMKRKLCVAISLCGNSKVVMLDEPTAGMDPAARRTVWTLLQQQKTDRTILLTTHFMDEADILGDRIAIMLDGEIKCVGSSFFLKKKFGSGYYMIMDIQSNCDTNAVTGLLRKYISSIKIQSHIGSELSYMLLENQSSKFEPMLSDLEQNSKRLKINSYGISLTPLEEVFMKVGADKIASENVNKDSLQSSYVTAELKGNQLIFNHIHANVFKKFTFLLRNWLMFFFQFAVPVLIVSLGLISHVISNDKNYAKNNNYPSLKLTLDSYTDPITVLNGNIQNNYYHIYRTLPKKGTVEEIADISIEILEMAEKDINNVMLHYIVGATFNTTFILAWYNDEYYHSAPLSLQLVLNAVLAYHKPNTSIEFINHLLPPRSKPIIEKKVESVVENKVLSLKLSVALTFLVCFYIVQCIKENESKSKLLQHIAGMTIFTYWSLTFLFDFIIYLIITGCMFILIIFTKEDGFTTFEQLGCLSLLLLCFGFAVLPFIYICSYTIHIPAKGINYIIVIGLVFGSYGITITDYLEKMGLEHINYVIHMAELLVTPFYGPIRGITDIASIDYLNKTCPPKSVLVCEEDTVDECCGTPESYLALQSPGIGLILLITCIMGIVYFIIIYLIDIKYCAKKHTPKKGESEIIDELEEDVLEERKKIKSSTTQELIEHYSIVLDDLTKYYGKFVAVNKLCLTVQPFECFGLLGVNGAGKTTAFKMLIGDESISSGHAWTNGYSISDNLKNVHKFIGYCPQFDALLDHLTVRENLKMFGLIRGVPHNECNNLIENLAQQFDFYPHLNKRVQKLSGGNKRKVSTAVALIGNPQVIYLDEPTTGMDPATKRFLWKALCKLRDSGKTIVLTSHSMEECQALCTRLVIMVNGQFKCLGSTQRLKNKFAQGYTLTLKLTKQPDILKLEHDVKKIQDFIAREFPESTLTESHQQMMSYSILGRNMTWSYVFGVLERNKDRLNIEDYSIGQGSLEQVFLSFTEHQY